VSSLLSVMQACRLRPCASRRGGGVGEAQAASPRLAAVSPRSPKVRGALGTRPRCSVHPHRRRRTRTRCARARWGRFRAGKRQGGRSSERADALRPSAASVVRGGWCAVAGARCLACSARCVCTRGWVPTVC